MSAAADEAALRALLDELTVAAAGLRLPPDANFFEAGLTSGTLVRLHADLVERLGRDVALTELFEYPNRRALARHLATRDPTPAAPGPAGQRAVADGSARSGGPGPPAAHIRRHLRSQIRARTQLGTRDGGQP